MVFKSFYKIKPKEALVLAPPLPPPAPLPPILPPPTVAVVEPKRSIPLPRTSSIKINTKASTPSRPPAPVAVPISTPLPSTTNDTIVASTPIPRRPSVSSVSSKPRQELPSGSSIKRPRPEKDDHATPVTKKAKFLKTPHTDAGGERRKRCMVTLKANPKRLAKALGQHLNHHGVNGRTSLPSGPAKAIPSAIKDSIIAKPVRKPLPSGDVVRKPLPGGPASSPPLSVLGSKNSFSRPPATPTPKPKSASPVTAPPSGTPAPVRTKIKIVRKPQPSGPPPAGS